MYQMYLEELAGLVPGARVGGARVKEMGPRLAEKVERARSAAAVADYIGGRIVVDDVASARRLVTEIEGRGRVLDADDFLEDGHTRNG